LCSNGLVEQSPCIVNWCLITSFLPVQPKHFEIEVLSQFQQGVASGFFLW